MNCINNYIQTNRKIPQEMEYKILDCLNMKELARVSTVSKEWNHFFCEKSQKNTVVTNYKNKIKSLRFYEKCVKLARISAIACWILIGSVPLIDPGENHLIVNGVLSASLGITFYPIIKICDSMLKAINQNKRFP